MLKTSTQRMLARHKQINAGGQRLDGLTTSRHIRLMLAEPMKNTYEGYRVYNYTQDLTKKLIRLRIAKAMELRFIRGSRQNGNKAG